MPNDKPNIADLETEKLSLEVEELKTKVADSKKSKVWEGYFKPIIPIAVTIIIAIFGWIITGNFNQAQLTITESKNKADKEIAQINASLSFIKLMTEVSDSSIQLRQQAKTVIAPALPPETSFNIAVNELPNNPDVLEVLIKTYKEDSWKYLTPFIEFYPLKYTGSEFWNSFNRRIVDRLDLAGTDSIFKITGRLQSLYKDENIKQLNNRYYFLNFLEKNQLLNDFYKYLIFNNYKSINRVYAILNYLDYIYYSQDIYYDNTKRLQKKFEILDLIKNTSDNTLKTDISTAATIVLVIDPSYERDWQLIEITAQYFWEDLDVSSGETPSDGSLKQFLYEKYFHFEHDSKRLENIGVETLSKNLFSKLTVLDFRKLEIERIENILYSYCENSPRFSKDVFTTYLRPSQSYQVISKILSTLNNDNKKKDFANYLGSLSGDNLFRNISQDKESGKKYAELLITWYQTNWKQGWYIPKFFHSVVDRYPELKTKIDKKWGVGT